MNKMELIATYDHYRSFSGRPQDQEIVLRGQSFPVQATAQASREEIARQIIRQGIGVTPEVWAKQGPRTEAGWKAAKATVVAANAQSEKKRQDDEERANIARLADA